MTDVWLLYEASRGEVWDDNHGDEIKSKILL